MNDSFYFPHDNNSFNDDKILAIREKFGLEGYGLFWATLESMSRNEGYVITPLIGGLSLGYGVAKDTLLNFLDFCAEIGLFKKDKKGYYSQRIIEHLEQRKLFKESGKKGAEKRWKDRGANGGANSRKGKERKEKERKESKKSPSKVRAVKAFGEEKLIFLTPTEYNKLLKRFGRYVDIYIEKVANWKMAKKKNNYDNDYAGILGWFRSDMDEGKIKLQWGDFQEADFDTPEEYQKQINKYLK